MPQPNTGNRGFIAEVFHSVQGEGLYTGARQLFIRLAGCSMDCAYCDTDFTAPDIFDVYGRQLSNPVTPQELFDAVNSSVNLQLFHSVSFTGGEPAEQPGFLAETAVLFKNAGCRLFLETSGCIHDELRKFTDIFDIFSIDIKLCRADWRENLKKLLPVLEFLDEEKYYLKLVFDDKNTEDEFTEAARILRCAGAEMLFAQSVDNSADFDRIDSVQMLFSMQGVELFYRPQIHRFLRIR